MAYSKKRKGFRLITVDNQQFLWRYSSAYWQQSKALSDDNVLTIQGPVSGGQVMVVTLKKPIASLTPIFVSQVIHYGLSVGWEPGMPSQELKMVSQDDLLSFSTH
jgi:hypothetical protein